MKKVIKYNRPLAAIVLVAVIVLSLVVGINRTLVSYKGKVDRIYDSSKAMSDLMDLHIYATKISSAGSIYGIDTSDLESALKALNDSIYDPTGLDDSVTEVYTQAGAVYSSLYAEAKDDVSITSYMAEIDSVMMRLKHNDDYNNAAERYNKAIKSFPASLFSLGRKPAPIFS